ncbi:MAG: hypothetical protein ACI9QL_001198, partial [Candidatus Omnitrophota bacterium]
KLNVVGSIPITRSTFLLHHSTGPSTLGNRLVILT